jgi:ATP-dependent Lon protease
VFPEKNRVDLDDLGPDIRADIEVVLTGSVEEVVDLVLR